LQIQTYRKKVSTDDKWNKEEKEELLRFLGIQATSWGMLVDDLGSASVREAKERMLLETWRKFTEGMKIPKPKGKKGKSKKSMNKDLKKGQEQEAKPSTSETITEGDVKTQTDAIKTPDEIEPSVSQTVLHEESASKEAGNK
jgi:hypothetical protein